MKKITIHSEIAYVLALFIMSFGVALVEKTDFGMSMVVAPAYIIHLKVSQFLPWFTFGTSEYIFQAAVLVLTCVIVRKVKVTYLLSGVTAVLYGFILDFVIGLCSPLVPTEFWHKCVLFVIGIVVTAFSVALFFHTYLSPLAYELLVKEVSNRYSLPISKVKTVYDMTSLAVAVIMSFVFFSALNGIGWGTLVTAVFNGAIIGAFEKMFEKCFVFKDLLPLRKYF